MQTCSVSAIWFSVAEKYEVANKVSEFRKHVRDFYNTQTHCRCWLQTRLYVLLLSHEHDKLLAPQEDCYPLPYPYSTYAHGAASPT